MTPERQAFYNLKAYLFKAESSLWSSTLDQDDVRAARVALRLAIDHLNFRDSSCYPDVKVALETADAALLGKAGVSRARSSISFAAITLKSLMDHQEEGPALERGA